MIDKFLASLAALGLALALVFGFIADTEGKRAETAEAQIVQLRQDAKVAKSIADIQAKAATDALAVATAAAGRHDRQATTYLQLPTPAPEDRCEAAQALVDEALLKERS